MATAKSTESRGIRLSTETTREELAKARTEGFLAGWNAKLFVDEVNSREEKSEEWDFPARFVNN